MKRLLAGLAFGLGLTAPGAQAQGSFEGETITYIIATAPGGGYDTYGRLIGKYLEKHLNADKVVFRNIPGAGHLVGANTLAAAEPDGLTIGTFNTGLIYAQILQLEGLQFDLREMSWIGKASADPRVMILSTSGEVDSFEALRSATTPQRFAASGIGSAAYNDTKLIASAFDLPIEVIPGFNGNEGEMAMLREEVVGQVASLSAIQPFIDAGNAKVALAIGGTEEPQAGALADTEKARSIVSLVEALSVLTRLTAAPPGVPEDRLEQLRAAYMAALTDPDLLAEAEKLGVPIDPLDGATVEQMIDAALNQSPETVGLIAAAVDVEVPTVVVTTPLLAVGDEGREIEFQSGDAVVKAEPSGSRTAITIDGAEAKRDQLVAGMTCKIEYDPQAEGNEPKAIDCNS